jgi:hypothetical protein
MKKSRVTNPKTEVLVVGVESKKGNRGKTTTEKENEEEAQKVEATAGKDDKNPIENIE